MYIHYKTMIEFKDPLPKVSGLKVSGSVECEPEIDSELTLLLPLEFNRPLKQKLKMKMTMDMRLELTLKLKLKLKLTLTK